MRVSVVIPLHNQEEFIGDCLDSVLRQTHPPDEVVVVDDGSTDGSMEAAKAAYPDGDGTRVVLHHQENQGLSAARNAGFRLSTGDAILPLDADDLIDETYLEKTLPLLWSNIGIVSTDMQRFGEQDQLIRAEPRTLAEQLESNRLPVCSLLRREAAFRAGLYWQHGWEDWELFIKILRLGWQVNVVNEPLFFYRVKAGGLNTAHTGQREFLAQMMLAAHPDFRGQ